MPVYVDNARHSYGRLIMSHMLADSVGELLAMADRIGVARRWFQLTSTPHFDVCQKKRALAIASGAIAVDRRGIADVAKRYRTKIAADLAELAAVQAAARAAGIKIGAQA